jgi:inward rectifier potassium channel
MSDRVKPVRGELFPVRAVGLKTALHEDIYHRVLTMPWSLFFSLAVVAFLLENGIFAVVYSAQPGSIAGARDGSFFDAFFFSVQTLGTIGYGVLAPATLYAQVVVTIEALTGMLTLAIVTGLTFAKFARPSSRVLFTDKAVIAPRDGSLYLMFRMANARHNTVAEASLRVLLLSDVVTEEGERTRVPIPIPLVRDTNAFFRISWTAMHRIDENSPFYGPDAIARLRERSSLLLLSISGLDETMGQTVHARYAYRLDEIVLNARFADIITVDADDTRVIDYSKFHELVPIAPPAE